MKTKTQKTKPPAPGCRLDTDGDGNCPIHPRGCPPKLNPFTARDERLGRMAYDAYCGHRGWRSVKGDPLPAWDAVETEIKVGWMIAAQTVAAACVTAGEHR